MGWTIQGLNPGRTKRFISSSKRPARIWSPRSLLFSVQWGFVTWGKVTGASGWPLTYIERRSYEWVELYFHNFSMPLYFVQEEIYSYCYWKNHKTPKTTCGQDVSFHILCFTASVQQPNVRTFYHELVVQYFLFIIHNSTPYTVVIIILCLLSCTMYVSLPIISDKWPNSHVEQTCSSLNMARIYGRNM
jgi:hypothetical protein